ncbi:hypothetical protein RA276_27750, partial [Pseudomonas syringae pv. tagetis]|uniref:hypothetical protein n=1 Tax=Pseudomonas syringae group genomosp. 7 TaxID=251699 RepID=UPI00376F80B9
CVVFWVFFFWLLVGFFGWFFVFVFVGWGVLCGVGVFVWGLVVVCLCCLCCFFCWLFGVLLWLGGVVCGLGLLVWWLGWWWFGWWVGWLWWGVLWVVVGVLWGGLLFVCLVCWCFVVLWVGGGWLGWCCVGCVGVWCVGCLVGCVGWGFWLVGFVFCFVCGGVLVFAGLLVVEGFLEAVWVGVCSELAGGFVLCDVYGNGRRT